MDQSSNPQITLTNSNISFNLAGNWKRLAAALIDSFLLILPIGLISGALFIASLFLIGDTNTEDLGGILFLLSCCAYFVLFLCFSYYFYIYIPARNNGQTFGKRFMKIKIIDQQGQNPSMGIHAARYVLIVFLGNIIGPFLYITILFHDKKQAVYDMLVNTYVVEA